MTRKTRVRHADGGPDQAEESATVDNPAGHRLDDDAGKAVTMARRGLKRCSVVVR